jgi:hypothetical protein
MANMNFYINYVDGTVSRTTTPSDYILLDLNYDYLIWTQGDLVVKDLMTHIPTSSELNAAAVIIDPTLTVTVPLCLLYDYSHSIGGYYTHKVIKDDLTNFDNLRYVFCFYFDGATATEPQLEAWDSSSHDSAYRNVLGLGVANNSFVKGKCTTTLSPGVGWAGTPLAGTSNVLLLNDGNGALGGAINLYANLKIVIPAAYATPAAETFVLTVRYTYA